jgi:beta-galactosidase/beta-glucuronidase
MMNTMSARLAGLAAILVGWLSVAGPALARQEHQHQHVGAAVANLQLNAGHKWATDAPLRSGMAAIRGAFDADHPAIHAGKETDAQYAALAERIQSQVNTIVANCHLPEAADANLHYVIADLSQGANLMRGQDPARTRHDGAALVHGALRAYPKYFDDPDWKP